jgi:hypothetical protein
MFRNTVRRTAAIVCDAARAPASANAIGDWHDITGHHRYYGSSASTAASELLKPAADRAFTRSTSADSNRDKNPQAMISHRHF